MSWDKFEEGCQLLAKQIKKSDTEIKTIFGIPRGGLCIAVRLSHILSIPMIKNFSYVNKNTLIVDDIADSGKTLSGFNSKYNKATLHYKPESSIIKPDFFAYKTKSWIVYPWEKK